MHKTILAACVFAALSVGTPQAAVMLWDESIQGDISNAQATPSTAVLIEGANTLSATSGNGDVEWLSVVVPANFRLDSIVLSSYASADSTAFIGFQIGAQFSGSPFDPNSYHGYTHFGPGAGSNGDPGSDLLAAMDLPADTQGFTPPLGAGTYAFYLQQAGASSTTYQMDFNVTPVPEPRINLLVAALCAGIFCLRRRLQHAKTS